jgi:hypothetical protein
MLDAEAKQQADIKGKDTAKKKGWQHKKLDGGATAP